ncbi:hypothetical protein F5X71_24890 [Nocardia brasiliensis]|uniref:ESX-1 secretion-associated protein n=1 Tax=Nocardia brasiliensis TaxID=37326 RepID=A0A6G9XW01_NOCBR|nr:hypothetical protein [Nocardia brasiliensis]QIS05122.1 hypothetical protein F5X71_24890 [Nocardia brasiliensis]
MVLVSSTLTVKGDLVALLQADIDRLNTLATAMEDIAKQVDDIDVRTSAKEIAAALSGTPIGSACELATEYTEGAWLRVSWRVGQVASAIRQTANDLATTDESFAARLDEFDYRVAQGPR